MSVADSVAQMAQLNNEWSAEQAQKQMDFQERMSNTAHQREMADLKAAGLNPVLSAKLGGASTPSGASASADTSYLSAFVEALKEFGEGAVSSAVEAAVTASGAKNVSFGNPPGSTAADVFNADRGSYATRYIDLSKKFADPDTWTVSEKDAKSTTKAIRSVLAFVPNSGKISKAVSYMDSAAQTAAIRNMAKAVEGQLFTSAPVTYWLTRKK